VSGECSVCGEHALDCDCEKYFEAKRIAKIYFYEVKSIVDCHENDMYDIDYCWPRSIKVGEYMFYQYDLIG